ncbi:MAG: DEAD/DEAH box helicase family protein [Solirubrobacterales bacterium]|nr:DEAD/DEAH box helicase family protein [Solirubrobacterales bacterium]
MNDIKLRTWQAEFLEQLAQTADDDFLLVACPAAGKTIAATVAAAKLMDARDGDQVVVVAPTVVVRDQWQRTLEQFGFLVSRTLPIDGPLPPWVHGVCTTYAQAAYRADQFSEICENRRTIVICDEVHHASEQRSWGEGLQIAFSAAAFRLMLSGTPFRTDATPLPFITYDHRGDCIADFAYDYRRAVKEGVCRNVEFRSHDGLIRWSTGAGDETEAHFSDEIKANEYPHRLRAALDPTQPYLRTVLERANEDLEKMRTSIPDAAGLVICDSQKHALDVDRLLNRIAGDVPTIAISDIPRSHQALAAFSTETDPWLVSVRMVSEGVDIPRLGVVVWLTGSSTELMVRQVAGRALRGRARYRELPAIVHIPADPRLTRHAERLDLLAGVSVKDPTKPPWLSHPTSNKVPIPKMQWRRSRPQSRSRSSHRRPPPFRRPRIGVINCEHRSIGCSASTQSCAVTTIPPSSLRPPSTTSKPQSDLCRPPTRTMGASKMPRSG